MTNGELCVTFMWVVLSLLMIREYIILKGELK